jgi:O-antigen/teichoic acid export membrane protein/aminoglycoside phosphotransferase
MTVHPSTATATARRIGEALNGFSSIARSGFALVLGTLIASALGMVFWALAARLLTPEQLGIGAALIAAITTLSHASQLNLRNLVHRYVPRAGKDAAGLIYRSYAVAGAMAVLLGAGFAVLAAAMAPDLAFLTRSPLAAAGFVAALLIWTLYALQEAALTARRLAGLVPLQSLAYSLAKIACLAGIVTVLPTGSAILLAWVAPALIIGLVTHLLMSRQPAATAASAPASPITWRQIASFFGWDYVGALATSISLGVAPLLVVSLSGAADVAPYYLAWSISYMLYLVSRHVGAAMLADLATNAHRRRAVYAEAIVLSLVPVSCGVAVVLLFAPSIMLIFGPGYVEPGADILRVLALASIPGSLVTAYLAICRAEEQVRRIAFLQVAPLVALLAIGGPLTLAMGPLGMAWGWLGAHCLSALLLALALSRQGPANALDFVADLVGASLRLARQLPLFLLRKGTLANAAVEMAGRTWTTEDVGPASLSDATTQALTSAGPTPLAAILKRASSSEGRQALRQEHASLRRLHADGEISRLLGNLLPQPLHFEDRTGETALLMSRLPGRDARTLTGHPAELAPVLSSIVGTMSALHAASITTAAPASWTADWIDAPLDRIAAATGRHRRCADIGDELRRYWTSTAIRLGPAHGDFCPDNLLVERDDAAGAMRPCGLVDWGGFRPDAPAGFDACTMAMTLRSASSDRQLGQVVRDLLRQPVWTAAERAWMASGGAEPWMSDETALRAMVLLVWLHHIDANLEKSTRYRARSYWGLVNIRLVLEQSWP